MDLKQQVVLFADTAFDEGLNVEINRGLPSVAIYNDHERDDGFFFQEWQAEALLKDADQHASELGVTTEQYLAWSAQNW